VKYFKQIKVKLSVNQHCGKNHHLEPEYFSMELVLRVNLGPLNVLKALINEVLASDQDIHIHCITLYYA